MNLFSIPMDIPHNAENVTKSKYIITVGALAEVVPYFMKARTDATMTKIRQEFLA
jgi:hypothetical protein